MQSYKYFATEVKKPFSTTLSMPCCAKDRTIVNLFIFLPLDSLYPAERCVTHLRILLYCYCVYYASCRI